MRVYWYGDNDPPHDQLKVGDEWHGPVDQPIMVWNGEEWQVKDPALSI